MIKQVRWNLNRNMWILKLVNTEKVGTVIIEYEDFEQKFGEEDYILDDVIQNCRNKLFIHLHIDERMILNLRIWQMMK